MDKQNHSLRVEIGGAARCVRCDEAVEPGVQKCPNCGLIQRERSQPSRVRAVLDILLMIFGVPLLALLGFFFLAFLHSAYAMMTALAVVGVVGLWGFYALAPSRDQ